MKLFACIKKDIELLCGGGIKSLLYLLLPVLLVFLLTFYMSGLADGSSYTRTFPIAVRDEDDTVMSHLLVTQLRNVKLFSEVRSVDEEDDESLLDGGCAAVITVPKDFFYDVYDMQPTDTLIKLNGNMPREASIVKSAISSLAGVIEHNQKVYYAAARIRFGELGDDELNEVYYEYSNASVNAALERLNYFELGGLYENEAESRRVFFAAGVCSMLVMFIPLCILRNFHEEKELGIISRLTAAGGGALHALLAKFIAAFVMTAVPVAAVLMLTRVPNAMNAVPGLVLLFIASFAFYLVIGLLFRSPERAQLAGNMIMLLMLVVGGGLFPTRLLPGAIQRFSPFTLPYYVSRCFYAASLGRAPFEIMRYLWPAAAAIPVLLALAALLYSEPKLLKGGAKA